jgi:predicted secreted protein
MNLTGGIVLFAVLWFLTLFIVVVIGQRSQQDAGEIVPGTPAGAPADLQFKRKLIWTTIIAAVIWAVIAFVILGGFVSRDDIANLDQLFR